jgi:hypothetical protein
MPSLFDTAREASMIATATQASARQLRERPLRQPIRWSFVAAVIVYGLAVMLTGYWFYQTNDAAAAYKAYHRARLEFAQGKAALDDVCAASRRCCIARCSIPRLSKTPLLQAHLERIDALRPTEVASGASPESVRRNAVEVWQIFHDEAVLWVQLGRPQ